MRIFIVLMLVFAVVAAVADKAAVFSLQDTQGKKVKLGDVLAAKGAVLIDFWELSCFSCKQALPKYQKIYEKYKDQGLEMLAISVDSVRTVNNVAPYASGIGITFPRAFGHKQRCVPQLSCRGNAHLLPAGLHR